MLTSLAVFLVLGAFAGVLAGLLGVGGGLVIVPMINYTFTLQGITGEYTHHMALATSLATIMFTSVSSFMMHNRKKAVIWSIVRYITPGILVGTFLGSKVATQLPTNLLRIFFILFLLYVGTQMLMNIKPKPTRDIPGIMGNTIVGLIIGAVSSFVGIGGGSLSVPYMAWCNVPMHKAIGTSAAIGFPIALAGALGYMINGMGLDGLPPHTIGLVYLPALLGISTASVCTAPLGVRLSHSLPVSRLKKIFACLLFVMATEMIHRLFV